MTNCVGTLKSSVSKVIFFKKVQEKYRRTNKKCEDNTRVNTKIKNKEIDKACINEI